MPTLAEVQERIRAGSPLPPDETEDVIRRRFAALPGRLEYALRRWRLDERRVLDVGCSFGHCLVHFGPGSLGIDNVDEHVRFCRALGLDAVEVDVDRGLDEVPDGAFEVAWVSDVVEHLDAPRLVLRWLRPKLRPEGLLLLTISPLPRSRLARAALRRRGVRPFEAKAHFHQFTLETARYLVERSGFRVEEVVVPFLDRLATVRAIAAQSPRVLIAARPDAAAEQVALAAERRNKPPA